MHDINYIRKFKDDFSKAMSKSFVKIDIDKILDLDEKKRKLTSEVQELQNQRNKLSKSILKIKNEKKEFEKIILKVNKIKSEIKIIEEILFKVDKELNHILLNLPNFAYSDVPVGVDDKFNKLIFESNTIKINNNSLAHDDVGRHLNMMDFESASKISGSRFVILKSALAKLERALSNFMLDLHTKEHGYEEISTPHLTKDDALIGTGQLPKFQEDLFSVSGNKMTIFIDEDRSEMEGGITIFRQEPGFEEDVDEREQKLRRQKTVLTCEKAFYSKKDDKHNIKEGILNCERYLKGYKKKLDDFFDDRESYNNEMLMPILGVATEEDVRRILAWYARLQLGQEILDCVEKHGHCSFDAEL